MLEGPGKTSEGGILDIHMSMLHARGSLIRDLASQKSFISADDPNLQPGPHSRTLPILTVRGRLDQARCSECIDDAESRFCSVTDSCSFRLRLALVRGRHRFRHEIPTRPKQTTGARSKRENPDKSLCLSSFSERKNQAN